MASLLRRTLPYAILLLALLFPAAVEAQLPAGKEFVVALPSYWRTIHGGDPGTFQITIMCSRRTNVRIGWSGPSGGIIDEGTIEAGNRLTIQSGLQFPVVNFIQPFLDKVKQEVNQRSFYIVADQPISVMALYDDYRGGFSRTASWAVPPVESYGTEFMALSYMGFVGKNNGFLFTAAEDSTVVTFDPRVQWDSPSDAVPAPVTKVLKRHQVFQVTSFAKGGGDSADLSGTPITSNKPIGMISFALETNAQISEDSVAYSWRTSALGAVLPPETFGGNLYYTVPMAPHDTSEVRVIALEDNTSVTVNGVQTALIDRGEWRNESISGPTRIQTSGKTLAMQISRSGNNPDRDTLLRLSGSDPSDTVRIKPIFGNPAMAWLPPVSRYIPTLQWTNPLLAHRKTPIPGRDSIILYPWHHYAMITAPTNAIASVRLDGQPVDFQYVHIDGAYATAIVGVNPRPHLLTSDAPISCIAYGFAWNDCYALVSSEALRSIAKVDVDTVRINTCDSTADVYFEISNIGNNNFRIDSITSVGAEIRSTRAPNSYPTEFPPGREFDAHIILKLPQPGVYNGSIFVHTDANNVNIVEVPFQIIRDSAELSTVPAIDFGLVEKESDYKDTTITVTNTGDRPVTITQIVVDDPRFTITSPSLPRTIPAGGTLAVTVRLTPREGVPETGSLEIIGEPCMSPISIPVEGFKGQGAALGVDRIIQIPGDTCSAESRDTAIVFRAIGDEPVTLSSATITGADASFFTIVSNPTPTTILPQQSDTIVVRYTPLQFKSNIEATLEVRTDADNTSDPVEISLRSRLDTASVEPRRRTITFPATLTCDPLPVESLTLVNSGTIDALISELDLPDGSGFEVTSEPSFSIPAGGVERVVSIRFNPPTPGSWETVLTIRGGPCGIEEEITLRGTRLEPALTVTETETDFGDILLCEETASRTFVLKNSGGVPDTITRGNASGSEYFSIVDPGYPIILAPGEERQVEVRFDPSAPGAFSGRIEFLWGPCNGSTTASFSATVLNPSFALSATAVDFGDLDVGAPEAVRTVTVTNDGDVARTISVALQSALPGVRIISPTGSTTLMPGESAEIQVGFDPAAPGAVGGTILVSAADPCAEVQEIEVDGRGTGADEVESVLVLSVPGNLTGMIDQVVDIPITIDQSSTLATGATSEITVELRYYASVLYPLSIEPATSGITPEIVSSPLEGDQRVLTLRFRGDAFSAGSVLGTLRARVLLGNRGATPLDLENATPVVNAGHVVTASTLDGDFTALGICVLDGDRLVRTGGGLKLLPPWPAPAVDVTHVPFVVDEEGWHTLVLYDAEGNRQLVIPLGELGAGGYTTTVDVSGLPSGYYRFEIDNGEDRVSVPFMVKK